ncbi:DUF2634 domain-containing protein [Dysosmobacter sp.]|uniref:DUF2634 domain-containing protein n=1 Tax=Dysosmobacter sp. TaxID=2591382 RepID=UPI003A943E96
MSLFPQFTPPTAQRRELPLFRDVLMDYEAGQPVWESGNPVFVTGLEAVKGWAWRAIDTARYRYPCFSWSYGCELENLIGQPYQAETKKSEAERYVTEALLVSPYIREVRATNVRFEGSTLHMEVELSTVYGKERLYV